MPAVLGTDIRKSFGPRTALGGVTISLEPGEVVALFGPNGAGKTTLLKILAGLSRPTSGAVKILGENPREPRVRAALGVLGHGGWLHDALSAEENLAFYAKLYALADARARIDAVLAQVGLADRRADRVATFSRGMRQRLSIARAVLHDPKVLFLDEPFTGLDRAATRQLLEFLRRVAGDGQRTVLAVTHELDAGFDLATRVAILARGALVLDRKAAGLDRGSFEKLYLEAVEP
ncbi:MAG TPA: heme ABC exporter ATP-binding protein CcmA [bacterium]|nr:heme ABC exporter ATP-binding protein CcmA [bacterium]